LRKQFIVEKKQSFVITHLDGEHPVFADYAVKNPISKGEYKVALRSREPGRNFCTCMDFKTNLLGTCKHIEAILQRVSKNKKLAKLLQEEYQTTYSSLYLKYGSTRQVMLRIGTDGKKHFEKLARTYFNHDYCLLPTAFDHIERFLSEARRISPAFRCYEDAMDFIITQREDHARKKVIDRKIKNAYFNHLLKVKLYPYQKEGISFASRAGRCLIADEMGLGKTLQAIGTAELFKKEFGIQSVLIVCPTSLKYQ